VVIHPLLLGQAETDTSFVVWGLTPGTRITIPVTAYLILGEGGPVLVDAGKRVEGGRVARGFHVFTRAPEHALEAQLAAHGLEPADIAALVLTHLHSDHTGAVAELPNARIVVQRRELQYAAAPYFPTGMFDRADIGALAGPLFDRLDLIEGEEEIAPGVRARWTGGHSPGHQQIEVALDSGLAIITGDTAYLADPSVTRQIPPGYVTSIEETMRALRDIRRRAGHVLPMHDPAVYERYPEGVR
jgi:N-acyl homoserine lactone hydrolase